MGYIGDELEIELEYELDAGEDDGVVEDGDKIDKSLVLALLVSVSVSTLLPLAELLLPFVMYMMVLSSSWPSCSSSLWDWWLLGSTVNLRFKFLSFTEYNWTSNPEPDAALLRVENSGGDDDGAGDKAEVDDDEGSGVLVVDVTSTNTGS
jgi:hypothetical protein